MAPKTLYDVVRPICRRLNILGYNYGNEKPEGWMRRGYKWAVKCLLLQIIWRKLIEDCIFVTVYSSIELALLIWDSLQISSFCLQFFFVKEGEMQEMMKRMKQHPVGKMSQKSLNKQLIPFKIYNAIFDIFILFWALRAFSTATDYFQERRFSRAVFEFLHSAFSGLMLHFPGLISILPCIVACYCRAEMEEAIEEMKRIKSPLRRAKARAKLMDKYQQLTELASDTDRALSTAMYFMKWILFIFFAAIVLGNALLINQLATETQITFAEVFFTLVFNPLILLYFPLFQYFYLAPSANLMFERMNRAIAECVSIDDQWLSRDPIARPYLLKMRMEVVERVSHMATEDPPFTLFGDVLDNDIKFAVILELIDMCNTLGVHELKKEMIPSRIYHDFMNRCIDCNYWFDYTAA